MDIFDEDILKEKQKNNKVKIIIIILIAVLAVAAIVIFMMINYLQAKQLAVYVDGVAISFSEDTFITDENGKLYIAAKNVASKLGYSYFNGTYGVLSEDTTKCHVRNEYEAASFEANSKTIYKTSTQKSEDTEYFYIDNPVKFVNGKLYITPEAFEVIFNATFSYDTTSNNIRMYTLDYLTTYYTSKMASYGYKEIVSDYNNRKTMIADMIVVKREDGKVGIIDLAGNEIIGAKYDAITYVETTKEFFVQNNSKVGLVSRTGKTKISSSYDKIDLIDTDLKLYLVQNNGKYGVLDENENKIIYLEYDKIGIDRSLYKNTNITNQYLLFNNCIPVQRDKKWGMYDKKGQLILPIEYDGIGCVVTTSQSGNRNNAVILPDYEAIIVEKDDKYGIVNSLGRLFVTTFLDSIYSVTESGEEIFEFEYQGSRIRLDTFLEENGIKKVSKDVVDTNTQTDMNNVMNTTNNTSSNTTTNTTNNTSSNVTNTSATNTVSTSANVVEENTTTNTNSTSNTSQTINTTGNNIGQ